MTGGSGFVSTLFKRKNRSFGSNKKFRAEKCKKKNRRFKVSFSIHYSPFTKGKTDVFGHPINE